MVELTHVSWNNCIKHNLSIVNMYIYISHYIRMCTVYIISTLHFILCLFCSTVTVKVLFFVVYCKPCTRFCFFFLHTSDLCVMLFGHLNFAFLWRVLRVKTNSGSLWLKLPEGIKALLLHSTSLPLLSVIFRPKKEKQGGSARADLMGCGIAICHSGHLDTYKWRRELKFQSLRVP